METHYTLPQNVDKKGIAHCIYKYLENPMCWIHLFI
jgi:hypothetical protein